MQHFKLIPDDYKCFFLPYYQNTPPLYSVWHSSTRTINLLYEVHISRHSDGVLIHFKSVPQIFLQRSLSPLHNVPSFL